MKSTLSFLALISLSLAATRAPAASQEWMPRTDDYTRMWWAEGFPSHTPAAPWLRVIQTGRYAFALNTETLRVPHFGALPGGVGYEAARGGDERAWERLPAAELALSITVEGKSYRGTAGGKWTRWGGPRLIESGRFFQRADATELVFTADDGARLDVEARFETAAWPDRLALIFAARPGTKAIPHSNEQAPPVEVAGRWKDAAMEIRLATAKGELRRRLEFSNEGERTAREWHDVTLALDPVAFKECDDASTVTVQASEMASGAARPVVYDAALGWLA